jgi:predicted chitinase
MNLPAFFNKIRFSLFNGKLTEGQVDGIESILKQWDKSGYNDPRWLAYILATAYHETARTMQPIEEYGKGHGRKYGEPDVVTKKIYYGRGHVQLTWLENYVYWATRLGRDLVHHPEDALIPEVSTYILIHGMVDGTFTGRKLIRYFNDNSEDAVNARRIINGIDKAQLIASYYKKFLDAMF